MEDEYQVYVKRAISHHLHKHFWSRIEPGRALLYICGMLVAGFLLGTFIPTLVFLEHSYHYPAWLPIAFKVVLICSPISITLLFEGWSYQYYRKQAKDPPVMFSLIQTLMNEDERTAACIGGTTSMAVNDVCKVTVVSSNHEMMEYLKQKKLDYIHSRLFPQTS